jgi:predicted acetyltransferase
VEPTVRPASSDEDRRLLATVAEHAFSATLDEDRFERTLALHREIDGYLGEVDGAPVGSAGSFPFRLTVPGGAQVEVAGVTAVGVLPSHRRRGVLRAVMARLLRDAAAAGQVAAVLYASESTIYERFGFGPASLTRRVRLDVQRARLRDDVGLPVPALQMVTPEDRLPLLAPVLRAAVGRRPGEIDRSEASWRSFLSPPPHRSTDDRHCMLHRSAGGEPDGYAIYEVQLNWDPTGPHGVMELRELAAADVSAELALWSALLSVDLVETVQGWVPPDSVLDAALQDRRALSTEGFLDSLWVRLLDVPAALEARRYSVAGTLVIDLQDESCPDLVGRWRLTADESGAASVAPTSAAADLVMDAAALGAQWLGEVDLPVLAATGRVRELRPGSARRAAAMFAWSPRPWTIIDF